MTVVRFVIPFITRAFRSIVAVGIIIVHLNYTHVTGINAADRLGLQTNQSWGSRRINMQAADYVFL